MSNVMSSQDKSNNNISSSRTIEKDLANSANMQNDEAPSNENMQYSDSQDKINNQDIKNQLSELSLNGNSKEFNS